VTQGIGGQRSAPTSKVQDANDPEGILCCRGGHCDRTARLPNQQHSLRVDPLLATQRGEYAKHIFSRSLRRPKIVASPAWPVAFSVRAL
jgi:hypothetical protein